MSNYEAKKDNLGEGAKAAGLTYSNVSNASTHYFDDKIATPKGHGFAAEQANHLADLYTGKNARIVGDDNLKNGADRIVDGINIQSKYCASGSKCIQECFDNGSFRYLNADGSPMQIEVPSDMYDAAVKAMEHRISNGEVPGVTDPAEAKNIVRKGHFTYQQVKNIAKAGTVESIAFDAASGAIIAVNTFGITAVLSFATALWNGEDFNVAIKSAATNGLKVGGTAFITAVLAGQLGKAGLNSLLVGSSEAIVKLMGPKAAALIVNAFRSGTNIYGAAAMKSAAKLLRGNAITGIVSFAVLSVGDVTNIFRGRISGSQLFKNLAGTAASVAGGTGGWLAGTAAATATGAAIGSIFPGIGTAIGGAVGATVGGIIGAFGGGAVASKATGAVLDHFIEDDADKMLNIIQEVFTDLASDYLINENEAGIIVDKFKDKLTAKVLKDMFASSDRNNFAKNLMEDYFIEVSENREHIKLPTNEEMSMGLKSVLDDIAEAQEHPNTSSCDETSCNKEADRTHFNKYLLSTAFARIFGYNANPGNEQIRNNAASEICQNEIEPSEIVHIFDTSDLQDGKSGIVLSVKGIYVNDVINYASPKFSALYSDISSVSIESSGKISFVILKMKNPVKFYPINIVSEEHNKLVQFLNYAKNMKS